MVMVWWAGGVACARGAVVVWGAVPELIYFFVALWWSCCGVYVVLCLDGVCFAHFFCGLLYESPGGNQVDGLPPVLHTAAVVMGRPPGPANIYDIYNFEDVSCQYKFIHY
jgi:hypothetical protein